MKMMCIMHIEPARGRRRRRPGLRFQLPDLIGSRSAPRCGECSSSCSLRVASIGIFSMALGVTTRFSFLTRRC